MKKGFTLVELLAVIVILGILLLIAVPTINKVIDNSKKQAFVSDAKTYIQAAKYKVATNPNEDFFLFSIGIDGSSQIEKLDNDVDGTGLSPYGKKYIGYVAATKINNNFKYSIYLKDGNESSESEDAICYSIGFRAGTVSNFYFEEAINSSIIQQQNCNENSIKNENYHLFYEGLDVSSIVFNNRGQNDVEELVAISKDGSGNLKVNDLLEKGTLVFLNTCNNFDVQIQDALVTSDVATKTKNIYKNCLIPVSVLNDKHEEIYLLERPTQESNRNISFSEVKDHIINIKDYYKGKVGENKIRLLTFTDIKVMLDNNYLSKENFLKFGQLLAPFSWNWYSGINSVPRYGLCASGGVLSENQTKCVWNIDKIKNQTEQNLRTYQSIYWISGLPHELDSSIFSNINVECYSDGKYKTNIAPALLLSEENVLITRNVGFKNERYKLSDAMEGTRYSYAYYVIEMKKELLNGKLYCMNDNYDGFEKCKGF